MKNIVWKDIKGYEGLYKISNFGEVLRLKSYDSRNHLRNARILKQRLNEDGYLQLGLHKDGKEKKFLVHRLVAETFIDKSNFKYMSNENIKEIDINKLEVNHINEFDKKNNSVTNLEWCTKLYNCNYGTRNQRVNSWKNGNRIRRS